MMTARELFTRAVNLVSNFVGGREAGKPRYVYTVVFPGEWVEDLEAADGSADR